jgi:hypothetical protein
MVGAYLEDKMAGAVGKSIKKTIHTHTHTQMFTHHLLQQSTKQKDEPQNM